MPHRNRCVCDACKGQCDGTCRQDKPFVTLEELPEDEQEKLLRSMNSFLSNVLTEQLFTTTITQPNMK